MTNLYPPQVGGLQRSVVYFSDELRRRGHRVLVVAPRVTGAPLDEPGVIRVPAIEGISESDFALPLPLPDETRKELQAFGPDIVHAHHPFLLGATGLHLARSLDVPLVYTYHTLWERRSCYVADDSAAVRTFLARMNVEYANLCDHVIAPSESVAAMLAAQGASVPVAVIPTGVKVEDFTGGNGVAVREAHGIPTDAFVVGYVGRLAPEKNLPFLAEAVGAFVKDRPVAHWLVVGDGRSRDEIAFLFRSQGLSDRLHMTGSLSGRALTDAYAAMDVFAFASQSETQGLVLAEALTGGVPVIAVDGPGVRDIVVDGTNGLLLPGQDRHSFVAALTSMVELTAVQRAELIERARESAEPYALPHTADRLTELYERLVQQHDRTREPDDNRWKKTVRVLETQWELWASRADAAIQSISDAIFESSQERR